uniref:Protein phosphatase 1 regulatory inhibitor subunit 2 n=1 Tax=Podarcis muralis TaxID=64176 RepID=A0A670IF91_PODMU
MGRRDTRPPLRGLRARGAWCASLGASALTASFRARPGRPTSAPGRPAGPEPGAPAERAPRLPAWAPPGAPALQLPSSCGGGAGADGSCLPAASGGRRPPGSEALAQAESRPMAAVAVVWVAQAQFALGGAFYIRASGRPASRALGACSERRRRRRPASEAKREGREAAPPRAPLVTPRRASPACCACAERGGAERPPVPPPPPEEKQQQQQQQQESRGERGGSGSRSSEATGGRASGRAGSPCPPPGAMEAKSSSSSGRPPVKGILKNPSGGSGSGGGGAGLVAAALAEASTAKAKRAAAKPAAAAAEAPLGGAYDDDAQGKKSQKWDEMNILATYHPAGKDYGLMKIDEPSTPYHSMTGDDEDAGSDTECNEAVTADVLAKKLAAAAHGKGPKILAQQEESSDEEEELELSPEEREKKRQFEMKRKTHYNEGKNIKLARQLIAKELHGDAANEEDDDDECDDEDEDDECDEEMRDTVDLDWDT